MYVYIHKRKKHTKLLSNPSTFFFFLFVLFLSEYLFIINELQSSHWSAEPLLFCTVCLNDEILKLVFSGYPCLTVSLKAHNVNVFYLPASSPEAKTDSQTHSHTHTLSQHKQFVLFVLQQESRRIKTNPNSMRKQHPLWLSQSCTALRQTHTIVAEEDFMACNGSKNIIDNGKVEIVWRCVFWQKNIMS